MLVALPAAAVLSAFAIELVKQGSNPSSMVLLLTVLEILTESARCCRCRQALYSFMEYENYKKIVFNLKRKLYSRAHA
jgi:hypothetical protein